MISQREIVAITLWWAEGTKSRRDKRWKNAVSYPVEVTNTNPAIIKIFVDYLLLDLGIPKDKLRVQIQTHEGDDTERIERFWSGVTGVSRQNF
nr:hypothetical protein [Candidatus Saccharibacteria bacterium]